MHRTTLIPYLPCLAFLILLAALAGCASPPVGPGTRAVVAVPKTSFFRQGPAQAFGPDFLHNEGSKVTVVQANFGYTKVTTEDGTTGFVSSDDLKPAPPEAPP